jgi:hypothetical protein
VPVSVLCTTAFSEVVIVAVVTLEVGAEVSTAAVVVDDSSSVNIPHEMMVRLKHETRIMFKIFFILYSKVNVKEICSISYNC